MKFTRVIIPLAFFLLAACGAPATDTSSSVSSEPVSSVAESSSSVPASSEASSESSSEQSSVVSSSSEATTTSFCPVDEPCRILPAGDSITFGIGSSDEGAYRTELFRLAIEAGHEITFVGNQASGPQTVAGTNFPRSHEGVSGDQIVASNGFGALPGLTARIASETPAPGNPHIILIHIGTNDLGQFSGLSAVDVAARLETFLDELISRNPSALIALASLVDFDGNQAKVDEYNGYVAEIAQERADAGWNVIFVDIGGGFPSGQLADGVHPNDTGYSYMGQTFYQAIESYLN